MKQPIEVILMMAMTVNGLIAKNSSHLSTNWTSKADKELFKEVTKAAGVIIMGYSTFKTLKKPLPGRLNVVMAFPNQCEADLPGELEYCHGSPADLLSSLSERGFTQVVICGGAMINKLFLEHNLVDLLYLTIEPKLFGSGLGLFCPMDKDLDLTLLDFSKGDKVGSNSLMLKYAINK